MGWLFAAIAGALMSLQGVMNTRLSEKIGLYESNMYVQGTAFLLSLIAMWIFGKGQLNQLGQVNKGYWLGGALGLAITITVMLGMKALSPTLAVSTILIAQLVVAALIDGFGWMGTDKQPFNWHQFAGVLLIVGGIILFKWKSAAA
ncbi:MAG: DMT family transporter [Oscillospiraceae bacterium]|jgi:transporter family-2 protein|nr:DMT family transporter [Oscillospiraceae bacterium]